LGDHHLAVVGGCDDVFGRADLLQSVELLDIRQPSAGWALLGQQLSTPRTTAAVAALDDHQILIIGGAPSLASAEVYTVRDKNASLEDSDMPPAANVSNMDEGRMGCQAACLKLPSDGKDFPVCDRRCVVVVGGESGDDEESQIRQFSSVLVYDVDSCKWLPADSFPTIPTPRTAMALCVAPGLIKGHL